MSGCFVLRDVNAIVDCGVVTLRGWGVLSSLNGLGCFCAGWYFSPFAGEGVSVTGCIASIKVVTTAYGITPFIIA